MEKLTKAEEEIMHYIWRLERCTVSDIIAQIGEPKPPHSTVSSFVRLLTKKGFVGFKAYGKTYEYFALILRDDYGRSKLNSFVSDYFDGSPERLVSFLVRDRDVDIEALQRLLDELPDQNV
jgi:BlaI family transcriptional regulator, penicillinase repressor